MLLDFLLLGYLAFRNSLRAKLKGQNSIIWVIITIAAFFVGETIGMVATILLFYKGPMDPKLVVAFFTQNPIHSTFALFCGFGGYLAVRYILDKMPDNTKTEI